MERLLAPEVTGTPLTSLLMLPKQEFGLNALWNNRQIPVGSRTTRGCSHPIGKKTPADSR